MWLWVVAALLPLVAGVCPNHCNFHGYCLGLTQSCVCDAPYKGADCSLREWLPCSRLGASCGLRAPAPSAVGCLPGAHGGR